MCAIRIRSKRAYGPIRIAAELRDQGGIVNHKRVRRLMKEEGLVVAPPAPGSGRPFRSPPCQSQRTC